MNPFAGQISSWYDWWYYSFYAYPWLGWLVVLSIGLVSGSFIGCLIYRLPQMLMDEWKYHAKMLLAESPEEVEPYRAKLGLWYPSSHCTSCGSPVGLLGLIPLVGYVCLRGRCRSCSVPISLFYPAIELVCVLLAFWVFWMFEPSWKALGVWLFSLLGLALAYIDAKSTILPDQLVFSMFWLGLIANYFSVIVPFASSFWGVIGVYLVFAGIANLSSKILGREALGWGDVKLSAALTAWIGWEVMPIVVLLATISALIYLLIRALVWGTSVRHPMAFGPFLIAAAWIVLNAIEFLGFSGVFEFLP